MTSAIIAEYAGGRAAVADEPAAPDATPSAVGKPPVPVPASEYWGTRMTGDWPLQDSLELGALPGAVPCARLHARQVLWEWGLTRLSENAERPHPFHRVHKFLWGSNRPAAVNGFLPSAARHKSSADGSESSWTVWKTVLRAEETRAAI